MLRKKQIEKNRGEEFSVKTGGKGEEIIPYCINSMTGIFKSIPEKTVK